MRVLLLAGAGPYTYNSDFLTSTLFDEEAVPGLQDSYRRLVGREVCLSQLRYRGAGMELPVLRRRGDAFPHLSASTMRSILDHAAVDYEFYPLDGVWSDEPGPIGDEFDVVGLSTTFICDFGSLRRALRWVEQRWPHCTLVLGGQFSNLKYTRILAEFPAVDYVIRGDGEVAFPRLLSALSGRISLDEVANLVARVPGSDGIVVADADNIDLNEYPSPTFGGAYEVVPYESMRGCPFSCKFCSYPAASPIWRYKSTEKICGDWRQYAEANGKSGAGNGLHVHGTAGAVSGVADAASTGGYSLGRVYAGKRDR